MKWYSVKSVFYEDGQITAEHGETCISPQIPKESTRQHDSLDIYTEWFSTREAASSHIKEIANTTQRERRKQQVSRLRELADEFDHIIKEMEVI